MLCDETTVIHVMADEIDTCKSEDPFGDPVLNRTFCLNTCEWGIFEWETAHLWLNSKGKKSDNKPQILSGNASAESVVAEVGTLGHLHLKVGSTSITVFRILLVILPHFV